LVDENSFQSNRTDNSTEITEIMTSEKHAVIILFIFLLSLLLSKVNHVVKYVYS